MPGTYFTLAELAKHTGKSRETIRVWRTVGVRNCILRDYWAGGEVRVDKADYEAWNRAIDARRQKRLGRSKVVRLEA